jgi:hypothetical protein
MSRAEFDPAIPSLARPTWDKDRPSQGTQRPAAEDFLCWPLFRAEGETRKGRIIHVTFCLIRIIAQRAQECRHLEEVSITQCSVLSKLQV